MKILSFGSLNIDYVYSVEHIVKRGETISSSALNVYSGGKGLNQSVAMGKAGAHPYHAGMIGEDGMFLLDVLKKADVDISKTKVSKEIRTGNAIIQNDADGDNCILLFGGANRAIDEKYIAEVLEGFSAGDILVCQNEISNLRALVTMAHDRGMTIVLNPSPMDRDVSELDLDMIDYFVLNEIEAGQLTGLETKDGNALMEAMRKRFPHARIVLTLGDKGSMYGDADGVIRQEVIPVKPVDTTAAGDTFLGYFTACISKGRTPAQALATAAKASAITITRAGAAPSIPWMKEIG